MTHERFITLETAKLLKKAGFYWDCYELYDSEYERDGRTRAETSANWNSTSKYYSAPTLEVAQRWLREVKGIYTMVFKDFSTIDGWHYFVVKKEDWESGNESNFYQQESNNHTYEEAQEAGIKKALELILEKGE